jgi:hypothetical protein
MVRAEKYAELGRPVERGELPHRGRANHRDDERLNEAELYHLRGDSLNVTGDSSPAKPSYRQAFVVAGRQSAELFELRAAMSMARPWRDQGKRRQAHDLFAPVYGWFTEGFDTLDLKEAQDPAQRVGA